MKKLTSEELSWLGHGLDAFEEVLSVPPEEHVAHALAIETATPSFEAGFKPWMVAAGRIPDLQLERAVVDPGLVRVRHPGRSADLSRPAVSTGRDEMILDARASRVMARLRNDDEDVLLILEPGGGLELRRSVVVQLPKRTPVEVAVPSLDQLAGGFAIRGWLTAQASERLLSQSTFAQASGVGLVGRAWACGLEAPGDLWLRLQQGELDPTARAVTWARSLEEPTVRELVRVFAGRVASFEERLASMEEAYEGQLELDEVVSRLVEERDDLASVLWVLSQTSGKAEAEAILRGLDALAATHHLAVECLSDQAILERLDAIAEVEPDRWWVRSLRRPS